MSLFQRLKWVLLVVVLAFVLPILPYALAMAQDTIASSTPAVVDTVRAGGPTWYSGLIQSIVTAVVSAIAVWFSGQHAAKSGVVAGHAEVRAQQASAKQRPGGGF